MLEYKVLGQVDHFFTAAFVLHMQVQQGPVMSQSLTKGRLFVLNTYSLNVFTKAIFVLDLS